MLKYFPTPYEDEILYSVFARYHLHSGNQGATTTIFDLFNLKKVTAITDFPCNLKYLAMNLNCSDTNTQIISFVKENTLFPLFMPFWPKEKSEIVLELMKNKSGSEIHLKTGTWPNIIKPWKHLRYCSECIKQDKQTYGEAYWHRIHQLPGVIVCPIHGLPTQSSKVRTYEINQQYYYTITNECIDESVDLLPSNNELWDKYLLLSHNIKWLLDNGMDLESRINYRDVYINRLSEIGLVSKKGQVDQITFIDRFMNFYGEELFISLGIPISRKNTHNWLTMMVRKCDVNHHPLKHVLLLIFLFGSVKDFFENYKEYTPFCFGPYPCLNAASEHYKSLMINDIRIEYSRNKRPYAVFSCSCGFSYIRNGPDNQESDKYKYNNILSYGDVWVNRFRELLEKEQLHLREVARILKIDLQTVRKNIDKFGLNSKWMKTNTTKTINDFKSQSDEKSCKLNLHLKEHYRDRWLCIRNYNSNLSKTQLRKMDMKAYNWLYYHDKEWLNENSPKPISHFISHLRVDWIQRDNHIRASAETVVNSLLNQNNKPIRISIERIGKELGLLFLIRNNLSKLPSTRIYLESVVESKQDFYMRKIKWAIQKLEAQQLCVNSWHIKQLIGLCGTKLDYIDEMINKEVSKFNKERLVV